MTFAKLNVSARTKVDFKITKENIFFSKFLSISRLYYLQPIANGIPNLPTKNVKYLFIININCATVPRTP